MSIPATSIDPSRRLDFYFRVKRAGTKKFIFLDDAGAAIDVSAFDLELNIWDYAGAKTKRIALTIGSGLSVSGAGSNEVTATWTVANTNINTGEYYAELYKGSTDKTLINGKAIFHEGLYDGVSEDSSTLSITDGNDDITIEITSSDPMGDIDGGSAASIYLASQSIDGGGA